MTSGLKFEMKNYSPLPPCRLRKRSNKTWLYCRQTCLIVVFNFCDKEFLNKKGCLLEAAW